MYDLSVKLCKKNLWKFFVGLLGELFEEFMHEYLKKLSKQSWKNQEPFQNSRSNICANEDLLGRCTGENFGWTPSEIQE